MKNQYYPIVSFIEKLRLIGIEVELEGNAPWIYFGTINGERVYERYGGNHGFTVFMLPVKTDNKIRFSDIKKVFHKIREILENPEADKIKRNEQDEFYQGN